MWAHRLASRNGAKANAAPAAIGALVSESFIPLRLEARSRRGRAPRSGSLPITHCYKRVIYTRYLKQSHPTLEGFAPMFRISTAFILSLAIVLSPAFAKASTSAKASADRSAGQSTAINGTLEGTVKDDQGALLPGVTVTVTNIDTGEQRVVVTNESGLYRAPLLSLGTYRISAELQGFKKFEQTGVSLRAGQTAVIDVSL